MEKHNARPRINPKRIEQFAAFARTLPIEKPLNFYSWSGKDGAEIVAKDDYPPLHAPWAIDFFFFVGIHNFGYWHGEEKYEGPLFGRLGGKKVKGSDLLWKLLLRAFQADPASMEVDQLATMSRERWRAIMSDDNGVVELLANDDRLALTRAYGEHFVSKKFAPRKRTLILAHCSKTPAQDVLHVLTNADPGIPGYREDPLRKKALLLMMVLANRPEHFIVPEPDFVWDPIVDYHLMRLALRLGLVSLPKDWKNENVERKFTSPEREAAVRKATFRAVEQLIAKSGRSMAELDNLMWSARRYCPETEQPNCAGCMLRSTCAQKTELFQPVLRTTAY